MLELEDVTDCFIFTELKGVAVLSVSFPSLREHRIKDEQIPDFARTGKNKYERKSRLRLTNTVTVKIRARACALISPLHPFSSLNLLPRILEQKQ